MRKKAIMATDENQMNQQDDIFELDDEMLDEIAGGELVNAKAQITLTRYIKECKLRGLTRDDAMIELTNIYGRNPRYCTAFKDYVYSHWSN